MLIEPLLLLFRIDVCDKFGFIFIAMIIEKSLIESLKTISLKIAYQRQAYASENMWLIYNRIFGVQAK